MRLSRYDVYSTNAQADQNPFNLVRIEMDDDTPGRVNSFIIADHPTYAMMDYYATMLNTGNVTERYVKEQIEIAGVGNVYPGRA
jgi:hypothetical protein